MMARVVTVAFEGVEARRVDVEVQVSNSGGVDPAFFIVGLADKAVTESRERVRAAFTGSRRVTTAVRACRVWPTRDGPRGEKTCLRSGP